MSNRYRHIPITPQPKRREVSNGQALFWTIGIVVALLIAFYVPIGVFLAVPFLVAFASKRRKPQPVEVDNDHPYDSLR